MCGIETSSTSPDQNHIKHKQTHKHKTKQACLSEDGPDVDTPTASEQNANKARPIEIVEEFVRFHPNTGSVDPRQPFRHVLVQLLQQEPEGQEGKEEEEDGDWCVAS
jgi:hypothetical protein